eukprot:3277084-Rhodomonas_salina.1
MEALVVVAPCARSVTGHHIRYEATRHPTLAAAVVHEAITPPRMEPCQRRLQGLGFTVYRLGSRV